MAFSNAIFQADQFGQRIFNYIPAVLKHSRSKNLGWFIEFYAMSSKTNQLKRYQYKINTAWTKMRKELGLPEEMVTSIALIIKHEAINESNKIIFFIIIVVYYDYFQRKDL